MAAPHDTALQKKLRMSQESKLPPAGLQDDILGSDFKMEAISSCAQIGFHKPVLITHAVMWEGGWVLAFGAQREVK